MNRNLSIKRFVRETLGCTCPDQVFEQIEDRQTGLSNSPGGRAITIGGRLLVYIWEVLEDDRFRENFLALLAAGRRERDNRGLNRFRAVLAVDGAIADIAARAALCFVQFPGRDDRMHFHVVSSKDLPES